MNTMMIAAAALLLSAGGAFAAEGNGNPFPGPAPDLTARPRGLDTGTAQYSRIAPPVHGLANDEALPALGSAAGVETANSLPVGFDRGTMEAQAEARLAWVQAHQYRTVRYAVR